MRQERMRVPFHSSALVRYGTAVLLVVAASFGTLLVWPIVRPLVTPLFLAAVLISAWRGGKGPGLLATLLSGLIIDYVFIEPRFQLSGGLDDISRLTVFAGEGFLLSWLVDSRKGVENQVRESREELRALYTRLQSVVEHERTRIAREIHDELGQELTGLKFDISWARKRAIEQSAGAEVEKLDSTLKRIDGAIQSVRRIATELRPPVLDTLGLTAAIEWQAKDFEGRSGIHCRLDSLAEDLSLDHDRATAVFRVFQESLTNVARHADATEVRIGLERHDGRLILRMKDNGKGIEGERLHGRRSLGIVGMQERVRLLNGKLSIDGEPGKGTVVSLDIPMNH